MVYETEKGDLIEADLPENNKSIKNDMIKEEVKDMPEKETKKDKKEDLTEDAKAKNEANMAAKYVKLGENYDEPDPEVVEADRKHIDLKEDNPKKGYPEKDKKIPDTGAEAGEMEAETPEHKKKKKKKKSADFMEELNAFKEDMTSQFKTLEKENKKLKNDITELNKDKIAENQEITNDLMENMSDRNMIPIAWQKKVSEKYGEKKADFIKDLAEGLSFAFGTMPGQDVESYKEDMGEAKLLSKVSGLGIEANFKGGA